MELSKQKLFQPIPRQREDFLTIFEKTWRDWMLWPITFILFHMRLTPNIVTFFGGGLIALSIFGFFYHWFSETTIYLIIFVALITDMIDGSFARNHNMVTPLGVWLDHIRDYIWLVWVSYIIFQNGLISPQILGVLFFLNILYMLVILRDLIINFLRTPKERELEKNYLKNYTMSHLQADIFGRVHFTTWGVGYIVYLLYILFFIEALKELGDVLMIVTIVFGAIQLYGAYQRTFKLSD